MQARTYDDYWLNYLAGHRRLSTRLVHYVGLFIGPLIGIFCSLVIAWWAVLVIAPASYLIALATHPLIEGNSNAEFAGRAWWSALSFFRMMVLEMTGRLPHQMQRALTGAHEGRAA